MTFKSVILAGASASVLMFGWVQTSVAQTAPMPPVNTLVDENGVDLINKTRRSQGVTASIGADGLEVAFSDYLVRDDWVWTLNQNGTLFTVSLGDVSEEFNLSSGNMVPRQPSGSKLEVGSSPNTYLYTTKDGDVVTFDSTLVASGVMLFPYPANRGHAVSMLKADGEHIVFKWTKETTNFPPLEPGLPPRSTTTVFLNSVSSSKGYAILYAGAGRTAVNLATDYCDLQTGVCPTPSQNWPGYSWTGMISSMAATASDGRTITYSGLGDASTKTTTFANGASETFSVSGNTASFSNGVGTWNYLWSTTGSTVTVTITDPLNRSRRLTYNSTQKKILTDTNALNQTTSYQYDSYGRLERITQPEGNYTHFTYDTRGNVINERIVAKPGSGLADLVTVYDYDSTCTNPKKCNKPNSVTDVAGKVTNFAYDANGFVTSIKSPAPYSGAVRPEVRYTYTPVATFAKDAGGTILQVGSIWKPSKFSICRTLASCENSSDELVTEFSYAGSLHADPTSITRRAGDGSLSSTTTFTYDVLGNVSSINGPLPGDGDKTVYFYDAMRRNTGAIDGDPDGGGALSASAQRIVYDNVGRVTTVETGVASAQTENALAAMTVISKIETTYDAIGREIKSQETAYAVGNPGGKIVSLTQATYDNANQVSCSATRLNPGIYGSLPTSACTHASPGTSGYDRIASYSYDNLSRVTNVRTADGTGDYSDTSSTYTSNGVLQTLTDGRGNKTTYEYDGFDRQLKVRYPEASNGAVSSTTDYDGVSYDVYGRATTIRRRDGQTYTVAYDDLHRMVSTSLGDAISYNNFDQKTSISRGTHSVSWGHDAFGRIKSETTNGLSIGYQYDVADQLRRLTWPDGFFVTYDYNDGGMPTSVREYGSANLATYSYNDYGLTSITYGNGTSTSFELNTSLLLKKLTNDIGGNTFDNSFEFEYDESGQIKSRSLTNGAFEWMGTPTPANYVNNGLNQMTSAGGSAIGYDLRGNLSSDGWTTYGYDIHNRLTSQSSGASLSYDPAGRLWQVSSAAGVTTRFLHSGSVVVGEYDESNNLRRRYVHGLEADEPIVWYEGAGTSTRYYLLADEKGSVVSITDGAGNQSAANTFNEFGVPGANNVGRFQYTGQMWMPEVGLYYYKARFYSPTIGRFLQPDPIGYDDGMNVYAYVDNDPVNFTDPTGMYRADEAPVDVEIKGRRKRDTGSINMGVTKQRQSVYLGNWAYYLGYTNGPGGLAETYQISCRGNCKAARESAAFEYARWRADQQNAWLAAPVLATEYFLVGLGAWEVVVMAPEALPNLSKARCCFTEGTLVDTERGLRSIEDIKIGELVYSKDELTGVLSLKPVIDVIRDHDRPIVNVTLESEALGGVVHTETFGTTDDHPWMAGSGEWLTTNELRPGQIIQTAEGNGVRVKSIEVTGKIKPTYNLTVADFHTYFVGSERVWVHNACAKDPGAGRKGGARSGGKPHKLKKQSTGNKGDKHTNKRPGTKTKQRNKPGWFQR